MKISVGDVLMGTLFLVILALSLIPREKKTYHRTWDNQDSCGHVGWGIGR